MEPCCLCGNWRVRKALRPLARDTLSPDVRTRVVWTGLYDLFSCPWHLTACPVCREPTLERQVHAKGACAVCVPALKKPKIARH